MARTRGRRTAALPRRGSRLGRRPERQHAQQRHGEAGVLIRGQRQLAAAKVGDLVEQLHFLRVEHAGQAPHLVGFGPFVLHRRRHGLRQRHLVQQRTQVLQRAGERQAAIGHGIGDRQHGGAVLGGQRIEQLHQVTLVDRAQHAAHGFLRHLPRAVGDGLVGQRQCIAHRAMRGLRQQPQRVAVVGDAFLRQDMVQVRDDMSRRHLLQVELQAARQHRDRDLLRVGGGEDELDVPRRLFQRLQHGVEGVVGQHVHFVDHVDLEAPGGGSVDGLVEQLRHLVDTAVGRGIHLDVVDEASAVDFLAGLALPARLGGDAAAAVRAGAVQGLGQDPRQRGLADAARAGEQVGVVQPLLFQRVRERADHVLLADQRGEIPGAPFAR
ncbi:200 kDa antigen p200 [Cupriavidus taiwanensis]